MLSKVAIITRTKDRPNFLRRAMLSALGQSYDDWVHVIVNDRGQRNEIDLLALEFEDAYQGRLQILHLPESIGMLSASNAAIEASESNYIIFHDDDDSLHPNYLKKTIQFLSEAGSEDGQANKKPHYQIHKHPQPLRLDRANWLEQGELVCDAAPKETMPTYHRLTHLPACDRVPFIKRSVINTTQNTGALSENAEPQGPNSALMDPSLLSQSQDEYPRRSVQNHNYRIHNSKGRTVNVLKRNDTYTFEYEVLFNETCNAVFFAMLIKALNGVELGGATTSPISKRIDHIPAGTSRTLRFSFKCLLNSGVYFINAGVEKIENDNAAFAHRIIDSTMFRVIPESDTHATGMLDFQIEAKATTR
jgi:glycosyltransferase involved in cell wall biosynthesis